MDYIKIPDCKDGYLYKLISRNLAYGVYRKNINGFIGIRKKFRSTYLFTEYHWDNESFATAKPLEEIEQAPQTLDFVEVLGTICGTCKHPIVYDHKAPSKLNADGKGSWVHTNGVECDRPYGISINNTELFNYLITKEKEFRIER